MDCNADGFVFGLTFLNLFDLGSNLILMGRLVVAGFLSSIYERLTDFCSHCGLLDHGSKDCNMFYASVDSAYGQRNGYGSWLRYHGALKVNSKFEEHGLQGQRVNQPGVKNPSPDAPVAAGDPTSQQRML